MKDFFKKILVFLLIAEARAVVRRYKPKIVAITGSVGKTSTKDAIYAVVAQSAHVRKSEKSYNSEFGLPLTILGRPNAWNNPIRWVLNLLDGFFLILVRSAYPQWLVLEVGADRPGDIRSVASWLPVDIAVITRLPEIPVHVEFFNSPEEVVQEKASLVDAIVPGGTLIIYADDERAQMLRARARPDVKIITFGFSPQADVRGEEPTLLFEEGVEHFPVGMNVKLVLDGSSAPVEVVGAVGPHSLMPLLAGASVARTLDKNMTDTLQALKGYEPPPGRMHLIRGVKNTIIIDDTYNSSPAAASAALDTLVEVASQRKIAVLGDMAELGRHSIDEHRKLGVHAAKTCDLLVTVGFRARDIAGSALDAGMAEASILQFEDAARAGEELAAILAEGDTILVKGSQSIRMERTVYELMANPERAKNVLVRQDSEWKKR